MCEVNDWSKSFLMELLDDAMALQTGLTHEQVTALVLNRNRVAKFLDRPTKTKKELVYKTNVV